MLNLLLQERNYHFQVVWLLLCERSGRALARWEMWVTQYGNWYELIDVYLFVCLFCSSFSSISRISLIWRRHHYWWGAMEPWGFFNIPRQMRKGSRFLRSHSKVMWHLCLFLTTKACRDQDSNLDLLHAESMLYHWACAALVNFEHWPCFVVTKLCYWRSRPWVIPYLNDRFFRLLSFYWQWANVRNIWYMIDINCASN